jgi:tyrosyl-tRNA synthetase
MAEILFSQNGQGLSLENLEFVKKALPYKKINNKDEFVLENILVDLGLTKSKGEAKRLIEQKGVTQQFLFDKFFLVRKGKKEWGIVEISN